MRQGRSLRSEDIGYWKAGYLWRAMGRWSEATLLDHWDYREVELLVLVSRDELECD
jgi:hypothetical protein